MRIIPIIDFLKANVPLLNNRVEPAKSLIALDDDEEENDLPICFVHALEEKPRPNETIGGVEQWVPKYFRLMYASDDIDLNTSTEPLEDLRDQVFSVLLGWQMLPNYGPVEFVGGNVLDINGKTVYWADTFVCEQQLSG